MTAKTIPMKKIIVLWFIIATASWAKAQTTPWISQGAIWNYKFWNIGINGVVKIEYTHDTILFGKTCQILKTTEDIYTQSPPIGLVNSGEWNNYTYNNGDTVFYLNNNQFNILYNFGAQVNDKWDLGVDTSDMNCSRSIVKVDSISSLMINSNSHRVLYTSDSANSSVGITGAIIEHIGSMNYLFPTFRNCSQGVIDFHFYSFSCFQDITTSFLLVTPAECENPYHVGMVELPKDTDGIYYFPNPVEDRLNINFLNENKYRICIYNLLGKNIIETTNQNNPTVAIDISNLAFGIYIATFENSLGEKINKKIIKK